MNKPASGSTIIESLVAIGLVMIIIVIFGLIQMVIQSNSLLKHRGLAFNLASEEVEAIRTMPFEKITNTTNAPFIEVPYNLGLWSVVTANDSPSLPNSLKLSKPAGTPSGLTGMLLTPGFDYGDFSFESKIKVFSISPSNWETGLAFRVHDSANYYRVSYTSSNLYIYKIVNGTPTVLASKAKVFSTDSWHTIKIITAANSFEAIVDGISELTVTDAASAFSQGYLSIVAYNGASIDADDVTVTASQSTTYNFDSDAIGKIPDSWLRFGLNDLPSGQGKLTISDNNIGATNLKKVTSQVVWKERGISYTVQIISLITK